MKNCYHDAAVLSSAIKGKAGNDLGATATVIGEYLDENIP
jgi:hypothetical protein